jgi:hypothetical protein
MEDNVQSVSARTIAEILSLSVDAFNQNAELLEIQRDGKTFYTSCQIYKIINKAFY